MIESSKSWEKSHSVSYDGSESSHTFTLRDNIDESVDITKALDLLSQIIEKAKKEDESQKAFAIRHGKASNAVGESWMVFHLKALKTILEQ